MSDYDTEEDPLEAWLRDHDKEAHDCFLHGRWDKFVAMMNERTGLNVQTYGLAVEAFPAWLTALKTKHAEKAAQPVAAGHSLVSDGSGGSVWTGTIVDGRASINLNDTEVYNLTTIGVIVGSGGGSGIAASQHSPILHTDTILKQRELAAEKAGAATERARILAELAKIEPDPNQHYTRLQFQWEAKVERIMFDRALAAISQPVDGWRREG